MEGNLTIAQVYQHVTGLRNYELSNHLSNVLATTSDRKLGVADLTDGSLIDYYEADVVSAQDYYPFGMLMPGRTFSASGYRYGFNGKEMDNEVSGVGNQYDYGFRIYNSRLGKFLSVDPLMKSYPWYTPYQFAGNKPIIAIDLDGLEELVKTNWHNISGQIYKTTLQFDENARALNGVYIYNIHNHVNNEGVIVSSSIEPEPLSSLDFLNKSFGYYNKRGNPEFDMKKHDAPLFQMPSKSGDVSLYMEFSSGTGSENTVIYGGKMIEDIKKLDQVAKLTNEAFGQFIGDDGKITAGETFTGFSQMPRAKAPSIWIPGILNDTKNPNNNLYGTEHFLGSFSLTIQMLEDGKTALFTLADSKTWESQTDHQSTGNSFDRQEGKRIPMSSTYQRYIWTAPIVAPALPKLDEKPVSDNTRNNTVPPKL